MNNETKARLAAIQNKLNNLETLTHDECLFMMDIINNQIVKLERKARIQLTLERAAQDIHELGSSRIRNSKSKQ